MNSTKTVLIIGTYDTKSDELRYLQTCIERQGGRVLTMDVSVLGDPPDVPSIGKHEVAVAAGSSIQQAIDANDENAAMQIMARGASKLTRKLYDDGQIHAMIALGGTMGTDLALDCAQALPMGVPKYIVSTVSFSPLIPPDRLSPDIQMILWAGGLYGLNSVCKSSLSQAAGAVLGAARAVEPPDHTRPLIGMTSLGSSCLMYMKRLLPELEQRGFEVAIFHATGMGGMAYEGLAAEGAFAAVMDFAPPELANLVLGSVVHSGKDRMRSAGQAGIPQLIAPGGTDMFDFPTYVGPPERFKDRPYHAHNRLIASSVLGPEERREVARAIAERAAEAKGPVHVLLPVRGIEEWDKVGGPCHNPDGLTAFVDEMRRVVRPPVPMTELDCHINDPAFCDAALKIFDAWVADGAIKARR